MDYKIILDKGLLSFPLLIICIGVLYYIIYPSLMESKKKDSFAILKALILIIIMSFTIINVLLAEPKIRIFSEEPRKYVLEIQNSGFLEQNIYYKSFSPIKIINENGLYKIKYEKEKGVFTEVSFGINTKFRMYNMED